MGMKVVGVGVVGLGEDGEKGKRHGGASGHGCLSQWGGGEGSLHGG